MPPLFSQIVAGLFPPLCVHCGREGAWLCPAALDDISHQECLTDPLTIPGVDRVIVRGSYDCLALQGVVTKLKYHYWSAVSESLHQLFDPVVKQLPCPSDTVIVPVPLHPRRLRERGFNQSEIIGRSLSGLVGVSIQELLERNRYTTPQAQLDEHGRHENIKGAFLTRRVVKNVSSVILVDDVITTGSTMAECASELRRSGVHHIVAVALAKG